MEITDKFSERIEMINEGVDHMIKGDFKDILGLYINVFQIALEDNKIYPFAVVIDDYKKYFNSIQDMLKQTKDIIGEEDKIEIDMPLIPGTYQEIDSVLHFNKKDLPKIIKNIDFAIKEIDRLSSELSNKKKEIYDKIKIETRNNPVFEGEEIYLCDGKIIMDVNHNGKSGYHFFNFGLKDWEGGQALFISPTKEYPSSTLESALKKVEDYGETLIIAHNTKEYPLPETVVQVVMDKYTKKINEQNPDNKLACLE